MVSLGGLECVFQTKPSLAVYLSSKLEPNYHMLEIAKTKT